ncbi:TolC family protein [Acidicapsa dinghuensis]|uniref:TolC family protein n=2 Tax=Acidicapsa dinghuensis TaxID=2218256 RepID=A0ABW1EC59_9BACT
MHETGLTLRRKAVFVAGICAAGLSGVGLLASVAAMAQNANLPSNPNPNPSSLSSPYYGSVTLKPATDEVLKLSLDDAVQRGLGTNLGLREAEMSEKNLHGEENEALQYFLPTITVTGNTGYNEYNLVALGFSSGVVKKFSSLIPASGTTTFSTITKADVTQGQINYTQTLFSGPVIDGYRAVRAAEKSAYYAKMSARGEVVQRVATAYLAIIADQADVANAKALLDADKVLADQAHDKHVAGVAANLDELRARVQYQQQEQTVIAAQNRLEKAEILLKREIGITPGQKIELTDPNPYCDLATRSIDDLKTEAYTNRQDYQNTQYEQKEARMELGATKQERLPTLKFNGNYGVTDVTGAGAHGTLLAMGTLSFPIFREASLRGDSTAARAQLDQVNQQLDELRGRIDQQVRSSVLDVNAAHELVAVAQSNVDLAKQSLSDETDRFRSGVDDTLPLVQAQATLQSAQSNLVQSLYQYNVAKLGLARSTGVLELQYRSYLGK